MTTQEVWNQIIRFFNICVVYCVLQLVRCVLLSFVVFALVCTLRKTILKNRVFLKSALWSLFIPVLFVGRVKFFYENRIGVKLFSWLTEMCMNHIWICWLYLCVVFLYTARLLRRRKKLKRIVTGMEKRMVDGTVIYVTALPVTPSTVGVFRPKIVMPEVILKEYSRKEIQMVLLHEKTHIRMGHLVFYLLWDILRVLLWFNPFLTIGMKYFREDMEEICDIVTMKKSEGKAYDYGQLLLKSMRFLQAESEDFNMYATFAGDTEYRNVRQRVKRIAAYKPYKKIAAAATLIVTILCAAGAIFLAQSVSYDRCNPNDCIVVYDMRTGTKLIDDGEALREAVSYDEKYIYIEAESFEELIKDSTVSNEDICFYCGGYYKLPNMGMGGGFGYLETADLDNGIWKIEYEEYEDILGWILKVL